ncbi:MAG: DUF58 domain-containing protein, partial [Muribaculaceae bacterium]|nr:DUF58 domain-containing protein [Muribaculaceae bacterium]
LETGATLWIDSSSKKIRNQYDKWWYDNQQKMTEALRKSRVDFTSVPTDEDFVPHLMSLFKSRR